jgi:hypothetical protein
LYVARGYPPDLVDHWAQKWAQSFWDKRLGEKKPSPEVSVLRTEFNPIWEYVNIKEVEDSVKEQWRKDFTFGRPGKELKDFVPETLTNPWVLSRKRTPNLGDVANRLRKHVLNYKNDPLALPADILDMWIPESES